MAEKRPPRTLKDIPPDEPGMPMEQWLQERLNRIFEQGRRAAAERMAHEEEQKARERAQKQPPKSGRRLFSP